MNKRIVVIGSGPGGYVAAIRAAQLGNDVWLIEEGSIGGTCLNIGCIPTKALHHSAELYHTARNGSSIGVVADVRLDWPKALENKANVVRKLTSGVEALLQQNNVTLMRGHGTILPGKTVAVEGAESILDADALVIATGSSNVELRFPGYDLPGVINSTDALSLDEIPNTMLIVGAGAVGVEFASLYSLLGTKVTLVEMENDILPLMDQQITKALRLSLKKQGVTIYTGARMASASQDEIGIYAHVETANGEPTVIYCEKLLVGVGRRANTVGLGLEGLTGKESIDLTDQGDIRVDANFQTSHPGIYAIGDCNGFSMLAHAASAQGITAVEHIMGMDSHFRADVIPNCVYTLPELASIGITEEEAKAQGLAYKTGVFRLTNNGKTLIEKSSGMIKLIADAETRRVLGAHLFGPRVTDMIAEVALCMQMGGTVDDIAHTIHAHPTISESVGEAAMAVFGHAIHSV